MMSVSMSEKNVFRLAGSIIVPGGLSFMSALIVSDAIAGGHLLKQVADSSGTLFVVLTILSVLILGVVWSAIAVWLEEHVLDSSTSARSHIRVTRSGNRPPSRFLRGKQSDYEQAWEYYRNNIERYPNRHLSGMVTSFAWEWNTGTALTILGVIIWTRASQVAGEFTSISERQSLAIGVLAVCVGGLMCCVIGPWTHRAIATMRHDALRGDELSPFFQPENETHFEPQAQEQEDEVRLRPHVINIKTTVVHEIVSVVEAKKGKGRDKEDTGRDAA